jgi:hypothetical protein
MSYVNIDGIDYPSDNLPPNSNNKATIERRERRKRSKNMASWTSSTGEHMTYTVQPKDCNKSLSETNFCLAPLPKAVPACVFTQQYYKEEGKTPMRYNDNYASANAYVASPQSDVATQRDFLLKELDLADYPKQKELQKLFNLNVDNTPKTYKEVIDIIKAGTYTIDPKIAKKVDAFDLSDNGNDLDDYHYGPMYGIVWPGPVSDWDGYHTAEKEKSKQYSAAKRIIMTGDAAAGLKALQDFEAWLPVGKSN